MQDQVTFSFWLKAEDWIFYAGSWTHRLRQLSHFQATSVWPWGPESNRRPITGKSLASSVHIGGHPGEWFSCFSGFKGCLGEDLGMWVPPQSHIWWHGASGTFCVVPELKGTCVLTDDVEHLTSRSFPVTLWTQRHFVSHLEGRSRSRASRGKNFEFIPKPTRIESL